MDLGFVQQLSCLAFQKPKDPSEGGHFSSRYPDELGDVAPEGYLIVISDPQDVYLLLRRQDRSVEVQVDA